MKRQHKILIAIPIIVVAGCFEFLNFMTGPCIKRIVLPGRSEQLSLESDGLQDRRCYVYLNRRLWFPKLLFNFDPYRKGIYSFDISKDGRIVKFNQSNETWYIWLDKAIADRSVPAGIVHYQPLVAPMEGEDVTGSYLWGIQSLFYRQ